MAKQTGLGDNFYLSGVDLSGDVNALGNVGGSVATLEATGIDKSAHERMTGQRDGGIDFATYFNDATGQEHATLKALPTTDVVGLYARGTTLGNAAAGLLAKQANYAWTRAADGALTGAVQLLGNGFACEWCQLLTAGKRTDTGAANGTAVDGGAQTTAANITSGSAANPTVVTTAAPHGLVTGDSVTIAGTDQAALNGNFTVTVTGASTFTVAVDLSGGAASGGTFVKTSTNFGLSAYLQNFAFSGTDVTVKLQHSPDNSTFADITGGGFTQITTAPTAERIQTAATAVIRRYVRAVTVTSGGVTSVTFAVAVARHAAASIQ